ncbi:MAG: type II toxin-antitoxin system RelE/ParE family toxin [Candidatus Sungbacteria bacterium]|nr:type II toxin-antitoxin system RelE/ParE family toxin [Candidatus Sungbacteria bacterium]
MPNLEKLLRKFTDKERAEIEHIIEKIVSRDLKGLNCKKLKGFRNLFRVRKGNIRIIFELAGRKADIINIERRREDTYKF